MDSVGIAVDLGVVGVVRGSPVVERGQLEVLRTVELEEKGVEYWPLGVAVDLFLRRVAKESRAFVSRWMRGRSWHLGILIVLETRRRTFLIVVV